jgi:transposase-like protein
MGLIFIYSSIQEVYHESDRTMHLAELITCYNAEVEPVIFEPTATLNTSATTLIVYRMNKGNCDINFCALYTRTVSGTNVELSSFRE